MMLSNMVVYLYVEDADSLNLLPVH